MAQPMAGPAVRAPGAGPLVRCAPDTSREELIRAICTCIIKGRISPCRF